MTQTIVSLLEKHCQKTPDAVAVIQGDRCWSYASLNNFANRIAQQLQQKNLKPQSNVAVTGLKSFEMVAAILAILKLNCSYMPLDLSLPTDRMELMLKNTGTTLLLSSGKAIQFEGIETISIDSLAYDVALTYENPGLTLTPEDPVYVMHTSGSTGCPKAVVIPHRAAVRLLVNTNYIHLQPSDRVLFHSNTSFDGAIFEIWAALLNGAAIVISPEMMGDLAQIFKYVSDKNITVLLLTTGLFHIFSTMNLEELISLRYLVVGGDVMHRNAAVRTIAKNNHLKLINGYGPAENAVFTTCFTIEKTSDIGDPVSIGNPITGTTVYLLDEKLRVVPEGDVGELYTGGLGVGLGYLNDPVLTQEKFVRLPHVANGALLYRTGDLAKKLPSGHYEFHGRIDNQVKIRGFRVELTEIETSISSLDFVEDVFVCVLEREHKKLIAFLKVSPDKCVVLQKDKSLLTTYLKDKLPSYCIPDYFEVSDQFPLTSNGKLDRKALQAKLLGI